MQIERATLAIGLLGLVVIGGIGAQALGVMPGTKETFLDRAQADDNVLLVASKDPQMAAEIVQARATLPSFLAAAETPPPSWTSISIKARLQGESVAENIWIAGFEALPDGAFRGKIANDPVDLPGLSLGDEVLFGRDKIVDWAFIEGGRGYGFYSVRAMLPMMDEAQREGLLAFLATEPVPASWALPTEPGTAEPVAAAPVAVAPAPPLEKSETISRGFEMLRLGLGMGPRSAS